MRNSIGKTRMTVAIVIALLTALAMLMPNVLVKAQNTAAHVDNEKFGSVPGPLAPGTVVAFSHPTGAILSFTPNPIGLGQDLLVNVFLTPPLPNPQYHTGYQIIFTKPDGTKETIVKDSFRADTTTWFNYSPDVVGTWTIEFKFLGSYFPPGNYSTVAGSWILPAWYSFPQGSYYEPSSAGPFNLTVQADYVKSWPPAPLPSDYWTRPVSPENREWWPILGWSPETGLRGGGPDYPADTNTYMSNYGFTPYVAAPNTAHILWRRAGGIGGLTGGSMGQQSVSSGSGGSPTIIYSGRCYQTVTTMLNGARTSVWRCYDLRTGQVYWDQATTNVPPATMVMSYEGLPHPSGSTHMAARGVYLAVISGGRLIKYNPNDGSVYQNISISPLTSGTLYDDPFFLSVQNMGGGKYRLINWSIGFDYGAGGAMINVGLRIANNISWPMSSIGTVDYEAMIGVFTANVGVVSVPGVPGTGDWAGTPPVIDTVLTAYSLTTGEMLWNKTTGIPYMISSGSTAVADQGKYAVRFEDGLFHCWDLYTGAHLWKQELSSYPWGRYGSYNIASYGGTLFATQYDGVVAVNWNDGKIKWWYHNEAPYAFETPYQDYYPFFTGVSIADGKVYAYNSEHTPTQPLTRGWKLHCINFTSGEGLWNITGSMSPGRIADGYLTASNSYDSYMYVFGKGPSATTVSTPDTGVAKGTTVLIKGAVMDMSPGDQGSVFNPTAPLDSKTKQGTVPCVSKASMATQMEYLYMQHPIDGLNHDQIMTGVPVTLTAIDSNNNVIPIGTTTTNGYYGTFSMPWAPSNEGTYTITASFGGDDSYGSSSGATSLFVGPTPTTPETPEIPTPVDYTMTIIYAAIAIIIAVVIAVALAVLLIRKRA